MNRVLWILKGFGSSKKRFTAIKLGVVAALAAIITTGVVFASYSISSYSENVNRGLADNLIRFHVVANSDSAEDQSLKRDVRDLIINYMKVQLKDSKDIEQTKYIINKNMNKIIEIAKSEIARQGKSYSVKANLGSYPFPTKTYGDIALPAGYYQALRVQIGKGEGANWWCVLFPPLCFVDATHGTVPDSVKKDLKNVLTDDEYNIVTSSSHDSDIPVKIKFKILEIFQGSKIKLSGMISSIFKLAK